MAQPLSRDQVDYAFELIDEIHPIEKYPIYVAFPYLKWISSRCCYGIPYCKPYTGDEDGAGVEEEDAQLLRSSSNARDTYIINGKEYKKRSKKAKKSALSEDATALDPIN